MTKRLFQEPTQGAAAGLPVLVNFDGEAGWICQKEVCGVVVPPKDPQAMADGIRALAADPSRLRDMGRRARQLAADRFDRRHLVEELEAVLVAARCSSGRAFKGR